LGFLLVIPWFIGMLMPLTRAKGQRINSAGKVTALVLNTLFFVTAVVAISVAVSIVKKQSEPPSASVCYGSECLKYTETPHSATLNYPTSAPESAAAPTPAEIDAAAAAAAQAAIDAANSCNDSTCVYVACCTARCVAGVCWS
jgi:hypothetical protein